jgi:hypothetical protein
MRDWMTEPRAVRRPVGHAQLADHMARRGPKVYTSGRACVRCGAHLSRYNAKDTCLPCSGADL